MTKLIAIHSLHLAGNPGPDIIQPGEGFEATDDELYLVDHGAARKATSEDKGVTVWITRSAAQTGSTGGDAPVDLSKLKKAELVALAAAEEIEIDETATNAVIIKTIEDARAAKQDDLV